MKHEFKLDNFVLTRDDIGVYDNKKANNLTDEQMIRLASLMTDMLLQDWDLCLRSGLKEEFGIEVE